MPSNSNVIDFLYWQWRERRTHFRSKSSKKSFLTTNNDQIKDNKKEKQAIYANKDSNHTIAIERKNNNSENNNNNTNDISNNGNIQDTITVNPSTDPSENEPPNQLSGELKIETTLTGGTPWLQDWGRLSFWGIRR